MKTVYNWFEEYGVSHQNPTNKLIHFFCVPLILLSTLGLLMSIPMPAAVANLVPILPESNLGGRPLGLINAATIFAVLALGFYLSLSITIALGMVFQAGLALILCYALASPAIQLPLWGTSLIIFAACWVVQLYGHKIEGAKPSFFKDLQFLLIGPAWIMGFLYRKAGIKY